MIIPLFKKPLLKQILIKYTKLIESEAFIKLKELETNINKMFDEECQNCKHFEEQEQHPHERFCKHKKGQMVCEIWLCPLR
jgi:hypothetical protein